MRASTLAVALGAVVGAVATATPHAAYTYPWQDPSYPTPVRVANLISLLTVPEKVSLLQDASPAIPRIGLPAYEWARECERGDTSGPSGTSFPSGIALGATWNSTLVFLVAHETAVEARANADVHGGGASCFGPVINEISLPLWGRTNEMLGGEDTTLASVLGVSFTTGIQTGTVKGSPYRMVNTIAKHLSSYSGPEGYCGGVTFATQTRFSNTAVMDERTWREFFLPPWRALAGAGVTGFMSSYQAVAFTGSLGVTESEAYSDPELFARLAASGVPDTANSLLLTTLLRDQWNWTGYILSDAGAVAFVGEVDWEGTTIGHGYAANTSDAAAKALLSGMDIELTCCKLPSVFPTLVDSVQAGVVPEAALDLSLSRTLPYRFELGTLDPPGLCPYSNFTQANISSPGMIALAYDAATQAVVLLKNIPNAAGGSTTPLLPLDAVSLFGKTVAVIGPSANDTLAQQGGYVNQHPPFIRTPLEGLTDELALSTVVYAQACPDVACETADTAGAAAVAGSADATVLVLGTTVYAIPSQPCSPNQTAVEAEGWDRANASLPGQQLALLEAVAAATAAAGKPLVVVLINAGMLDVAWAQASPAVHAIVHAPFLGMTSGLAIASVLVGRANPAGRLTHTWYTAAGLASVGGLTDYRMRNDSATGFPGRTYRYTSAPVQYPFGFGLSYSTFSYSAPTVAPSATPAPCDTVTVTVTVTNTSPLDGDEVVQLYLTLGNASVPVPRRQLAAFARVFVPGNGGTAKVTLEVRPSLQSVMRAGDYVDVVEPGLRTLWVGGASDPAVLPGAAAAYTVVGTTTPVGQCG
jgi:beta-glucosidase